jgi:hypothetical protein
MTGGSSVFARGFDAGLFWDLLEPSGATWYYAAPTMHHQVRGVEVMMVMMMMRMRMRMRMRMMIIVRRRKTWYYAAPTMHHQVRHRRRDARTHRRVIGWMGGALMIVMMMMMMRRRKITRRRGVLGYAGVVLVLAAHVHDPWDDARPTP